MTLLLVSTTLLLTLFVCSCSSSGWIQLSYLSNDPQPSGRVFPSFNTGAPVPPPWNPDDRYGLVVFGGAGDPDTWAPVYNDLWILNSQDNHADGRAWTLVDIDPSSPVPEARCLGAVAVEPSSGVMYLFGGFNGTTWFNDLWKIDLTVVQYPGTQGHWIQIFPSNTKGSPEVRCGMTITFCKLNVPDTLLIYLFGGGVDKRELYNDIWTFDVSSETWSELTWYNTKLPPPREFHGAYCGNYWGNPPSQTELLIFGGYDYGYSYYNDYWGMQTETLGVTKGTWIAVRVSNTPPPRANFAYAGGRDPTMEQMILLVFGGRDDNGTLDDTWLWTQNNKAGWSQVANQGDSPEARFGMASGLALNTEGQLGMVMFGGSTTEGSLFNDTWFYTF
eukprot:TRINITY_DN2476_c0_g1_i1.p1 TRINITY_DN2476_c0_g1~~TRINITY_DN2476_c0_g1_i1.p1  ORF type:complete len:389 (-),score=63.84 TRINITY_DN2476_c0_g1_i1:110-1276(-)